MRNIVFVWGWGTGMATLILALHGMGFENLICVDGARSQMTDLYESKWIKVIIGDGAEYVVTHDDFVIYSNIKAIVDGPIVTQSQAIFDQYNPKKSHRPYSYNEFLWELSKHFRTVSLAWSNGKSSITGLAAFTASKILPNFWLALVPAFMPDYNQNNFVINPNITSDLTQIFKHIFSQKWSTLFDHSLLKKYYLFIEACEYQENFLLYDNDYAIITNIDHDHTDYYPLYEDYVWAFINFIRRTRYKVIVSSQAKTEIDIYLKNESDRDDVLSKMLVVDTNPGIAFEYLFGEHHQMNAGKLMALYGELVAEQGVAPSLPAESWPATFTKFRGIRRRMELLRTFDNWGLLYTDYSHHAPAMAANFKALRAKYPDKKLIAIFQPHQAKRVLEWWDHFAEPLRKFDEAIIYKLYTAREKIEDFDFSSVTNTTINSFDQLWEEFAKHCWWKYITDFDYIKDIINIILPNRLIVLFTAGDLDYRVRGIFD